MIIGHLDFNEEPSADTGVKKKFASIEIIMCSKEHLKRVSETLRIAVQNKYTRMDYVKTKPIKNCCMNGGKKVDYKSYPK